MTLLDIELSLRDAPEFFRPESDYLIGLPCADLVCAITAAANLGTARRAAI